MLTAQNIELAYGDGDELTYAVRAVNIALPEKGFVGIMGPSGSGKSSLLYLLSGLKRPTSGQIEFADRQYSGMNDAQITDLRRRKFGFVFQQPFLLHYLTARENVVTGCEMGDANADNRAAELLDHLGIGHLGERFPHKLSGGERQRVCVARAIVSTPEVIFADEPTAALDHANGHAVINLLQGYRERGLVIVVTHDPEMVAEADLVYKMRDGRLED